MKDSNLILTNPNEISKIFTTLRHPTSQILMNYLLYKNKQDYVWWTVSALHQATKKSESTIKTTLKKFIELSLVKTTKAKHVPIIKKVIHKKKVEQTMSLFSDLLELEEMEEEVDEIIIKNSVNVYKLNTDTIYLIFGSNNKFHSIVDENLALMPMKLGKLENELKASAVKLKRIFSDKEIELTDEYDIRLSNLFSVYNNCYFLKNIELNDNSSIKGIFITEFVKKYEVKPNKMTLKTMFDIHIVNRLDFDFRKGYKYSLSKNVFQINFKPSYSGNIKNKLTINSYKIVNKFNPDHNIIEYVAVLFK